ncbi:MAG: homocysteine S-methyltransferase family protein [Spirochaetota bacterium]
MNTKSDFIDLINSEFVVHDGAFGTLLQERGLRPDELPEEWNIKRPDIVRNVHLEYLKAGAQIITTNTFGASTVKMGMRGKDALVKDVNKRGVKLAFEALGEFASSRKNLKLQGNGRAYVAGSVGPLGKMLGIEITEKEAERAFSLQVQLLAEAGADLILIETMIDLAEASLALKSALRETRLPVVVSLVFNRTKQNNYRTLFGNSPVETVKRLEDGGACAVGANCGLIEHYIDVIREMRGVSRLPLILYPNAGKPVLRDGVTFYETKPWDMIVWLEDSIEAGATIIGGCCGTNPEYISMISQRIRHKKRER